MLLGNFNSILRVVADENITGKIMGGQIVIPFNKTVLIKRRVRVKDAPIPLVNSTVTLYITQLD